MTSDLNAILPYVQSIKFSFEPALGTYWAYYRTFSDSGDLIDCTQGAKSLEQLLNLVRTDVEYK